ncbi:DNA methyltransferase, partial [Thermomonas sp.]|uniref:DNA methyltransferase n=1 Tax=Thermomonas sp. TaxID=1971895 RepID=UPI003D0C2F09
MTSAREKFIALLKDDILQMELASLDFGIYRILNFRRREIEDFLDRELPARIDAALATLPGAPTEDEQGRLFHHLYTFFSRYYDDGDFVTRPRRGRDAAYSVPYNGQDVHFWWATKGSHYVKSGERFASYVWKDGPRAIRIEVAQADIEKDNVKGAKRYYVPAAVDTTDDTLVIRLAYRPLDADEAKRFEKRKAADDQDDGDDAPGGRTTQERILNAWLDGNGPRKAKIPAGVDKALLRKHVARYVAGQTSDFFVHPQLGEFLSGELDWYLKNEFLEIWDRADGDALARERGKLAIVRDIGNALIAFLAAIEDVQAQLFEKRKFVLASDWLARVSALPQGKAAQALIADACANADQVNEWLGWLGREPLKGRALANATKHGEALLAEFPHLCIHTRHFDEGFKLRLLSLFDDIEAATGGVLVHSENYAALRTLEYAYRQRIKCIYIDPPYNTGKDGFAYKDDLPHASWLTMIRERSALAREWLTLDGLQCCSIADQEYERLKSVLTDVFGHENFLANFIWNNEGNIDNQSKVKINHEYVLAFCKDESKYPHASVIAPDIGSESKLFNDTIENSITKNGPANPPSEVVLPRGFPAAFESGQVEARDTDWPHLRDAAIVENNALTRRVRAYSGWSSRALLNQFIANSCKPILDAKGRVTWFKLTQTGAIYGYKTRESQSHVLSVIRGVGTVKQMASQL